MMKKILLAVVLFAGSMNMLSAQDSGLWLGGSILVSGQTVGSTTISTFSILPEAGFNLNSNWAVGGKIGYTAARQDLAAGTDKTNTTSIVPFGRFTFAEAGNFGFMAQAELPISFSGGELPGGGSKDVVSSFGLRVRPGVVYTISERFGIHMLMPSLASFSTASNDVTNYKLGINDGYTIQGYLLNTSIGFVYKL